MKNWCYGSVNIIQLKNSNARKRPQLANLFLAKEREGANASLFSTQMIYFNLKENNSHSNEINCSFSLLIVNQLRDRKMEVW